MERSRRAFCSLLLTPLLCGEGARDIWQTAGRNEFLQILRSYILFLLNACLIELEFPYRSKGFL